MYAKRNYGFWMTINWSKKPFIYGLIYASIVTVLFVLLKKQFGINLSLPWQPVSTLGVAVAFYLGFKNNASYDRTWEARKIWGAIVNNSRSFGAVVTQFVKGNDKELVHKEFIYRHIAWLTALRYQLRLARDWEHVEDRLEKLYSANVSSEYYKRLDKELLGFIDDKECDLYKNAANIATQILVTQTRRLEEEHTKGNIDLFKQLEIQKLINSFYDEQGKSERIKNFPFPRQYASTALWMTLIFALLMPFGMLDIMTGFDVNRLWMTVPLTAMTIWMFFLMEMIGDYSENPFEGSYNDVPITAIARTIEIDLREMIRDENIPKPIGPDEMGFLL
jgi:putative membrane protein